MSDVLFTLAQFIYILWPLFIVSALLYALWGYAGIGALFNRSRRRTVLRRTQLSLLQTWLVLLGFWLLSLNAEGQTPSIFPEPYNSLAFFGGAYILIFLELYRLRLIPRRLRARIELHETDQLEALKVMDPVHFEELVAETYRALGYAAQRVGKAGDHGVDVLLYTPSGQRWIVQCKRYRERVGESVVRELYGTLMSERADRAVLVTSADISQPAEAWARGKPIILVDGPALLRLMDDARRKSRGKLFDRFTRWFEDWFLPEDRPRGLRGPAAPAEVLMAQTAASETVMGTGPEAHPIPEAAPSLLAAAARPEASIQPVAATQTGSTVPPVQSPAITPRTLTDPAPSIPLPAADRVNGAHRPAQPLPARPADRSGDSARAPACPACGGAMVAHPRVAANSPRRKLYRCASYPECRAVVAQ